ncbi:MAG: endonuclease domain-containing protein [Microvirga sp.]
MPTLFRDDPADAPSSRERSRARALRQRMTEPEKRLWRHLRQRLPVERTHFRRQVPIEGYVADFCCLKARLVIEVDGNQHGFDANAQRDAARTEALKSRGYRMLRFSNREVMTAIDIVLDTILAALGPSPPTPGPSPPGGEGWGGENYDARLTFSLVFSRITTAISARA